MQIFQRRQQLISEEMVKTYLRKHIQTLWGIHKDDPKRISRRKIKIEKDQENSK